MGGLSRAEGYHSHIRIWGPHDLFWHFIKNKVPVGQYVMTMSYVVKCFLWTWTWVAMICRPTQSLSFSYPPPCSLTHSLSLWGIILNFAWTGTQDLWGLAYRHISHEVRSWGVKMYSVLPRLPCTHLACSWINHWTVTISQRQFKKTQ